MYKVLIADDEILDMTGLQEHVEWDRFGMTVVAAANNGQSAWEYISANPVDILVSDIHMPIMSGLELARKALEHNPNLRVVFVSGYSDFQYAKQAIAMSANGYVLKPIDDEELYDVLHNVKQDLDQADQLSDWKKNEIVSRLLSGQEVKTNLRCELGVRVAVIEFDNGLSQQQASDEMFKVLTNAIRAEQLEYYGRTDSGRMAVVLESGSAAEKLQRMMNQVHERAGGAVTMGLGHAVYDVRELPESHKDAQRALSYKLFQGKGTIIQTADIPKQTTQQANKLDDVLEALFAAIINYRLDEIDGHIEELCQQMKSYHDKHSVYAYILHTISLLDVKLRQLNEDLFVILDLDFGNIDILFQFETLAEIRTWLRHKLHGLSEYLQDKKRNKNRKLIDDIEAYISDHLEEEFTLRDVAQYFSFSPNYLGYIFKEEKGAHFSDYVIARRMELASRLLQVPGVKIYEVASRLGYKKLNSFNRQFKKQFGLTPSEYRK